MKPSKDSVVFTCGLVFLVFVLYIMWLAKGYVEANMGV